MKSEILKKKKYASRLPFFQPNLIKIRFFLAISRCGKLRKNS